jgi:hypothetical protein
VLRLEADVGCQKQAISAYVWARLLFMGVQSSSRPKQSEGSAASRGFFFFNKKEFHESVPTVNVIRTSFRSRNGAWRTPVAQADLCDQARGDGTAVARVQMCA